MSIIKVFLLAGIISFLSGCDKSPQPDLKVPKPAVVYKDPQKMEGVNSEAPTTKELLKYYSEHLKEAKEHWDKCKINLDKVSESEKPRCVAAGNAWHNQPYKANR